MTRDEIIKLATQAGWQMPTEWDATDGFSRRVERFAALVAAREREACAKRCERVADDYIAANGRHAAAIAHECAVAIRAAGDKP